MKFGSLPYILPEGDKEKILDLSFMPPVEGCEEKVNEGKGIKFLTPNKLLTGLPVLAQRKVDNNLKYEIDYHKI